MKNFLRTLRFAWPYRRRLVISIGCALFAAALWSLNFTAIYPILKIFTTGQNLQAGGGRGSVGGYFGGGGAAEGVRTSPVARLRQDLSWPEGRRVHHTSPLSAPMVSTIRSAMPAPRVSRGLRRHREARPKPSDEFDMSYARVEEVSDFFEDLASNTCSKQPNGTHDSITGS